mgnify:CR=1 FL=1
MKKDTYKTIRVIADDKYFEDKKIQEQMKKMKKLISKKEEK